jgi:hypothetical protein
LVILKILWIGSLYYRTNLHIKIWDQAHRLIPFVL